MASDLGSEVEDFLRIHPLKSRWLEEIVDVLIGTSNWTAHVREIARSLRLDTGRDINSIEETVTRRINDYCPDAYDFDKPPDRVFFRRVAPATYKLATFPQRPNIRELVPIAFEDADMQGMWAGVRQEQLS